MPRDLLEFARASGYEPVPCPGCAGSTDDSACGNCGGSGRLWTSPHGSLDDAGLARLKHRTA